MSLEQQIPFSKYYNSIKLKRTFNGTKDYETGVHDIQSIWYCTRTGTCYAFYRSSGLRVITDALYVEMCDRPDDGKRYIMVDGYLQEVPNVLHA